MPSVRLHSHFGPALYFQSSLELMPETSNSTCLYIASNGKRRRQPGQDAAHFKTDTSSGRIVIDDDTFKSTPTSKDPSDDLAGQAYREQMTSVDGFTRGPNGEVKFHKNTKKRRADEAAADALYGDAEAGDVEMGDGTQAPAATATDAKKKKKKTERTQLGQEFKAKVSPNYYPLSPSLSE